jgi:hypothetical protein
MDVCVSTQVVGVACKKARVRRSFSRSRKLFQLFSRRGDERFLPFNWQRAAHKVN